MHSVYDFHFTSVRQWPYYLFFYPEGGMGEETAHIEAATQQTLHYTLANQQVQFHRIGEDGQVQVVSIRHLIRQCFYESINNIFYLLATTQQSNV